MQMTFHHTPMLFHEASELLYLYANQLPMPVPTQKNRPYAIPAEELEQIITLVCSDIPLDSEVLQFYFRRYKLPSGAYTCLARGLTISFVDMPCTTAQQGADCICYRLNLMREQQLVFKNLSMFTLDSSPGHGEADAGISVLDAPAAYCQKLLAVYQDPEGQLAHLVKLMEPVMDHLSRALLPWVARASMMLQAWEEKMREMAPEAFLQEYLHTEGAPPIAEIQASVLYFAPLWIISGWEDRTSTLKIFIGAGIGILWDDDAVDLRGWEYRALQILSHPDRFRMLRALGEKPMSSREVSRELGLHLGTVTRDVNHMNEAYLLNEIRHGARRRYGLNYQAIRTLARHLLAMCPEET